MSFFREKVFPGLSEALWLLLLFLDLTRMADSTLVKFSAICLCLVTALLGTDSPDGKLVALALCFTVGADWFLLVRNDHYPLGVTLFLMVQALYAYRLYLLRGRRRCKWGAILRGTALAIFAAAALLLFIGTLSAFPAIQNGDEPAPFWSALLAIFSPITLLFILLPLLYFANLCVNTAEAFAIPRDRYSRRFAWGLLLFVGCDICVGAWNLELLGDFARIGMWLFYLPSQVLIVLSVHRKGEEP